MEITGAMMRAARKAEFAYHQRANRGRFGPLDDALIRAIVDAAISAIGVDDDPEPAPPLPPELHEEPPPLAGKVRIVTARKPKPKHRSDR